MRCTPRQYCWINSITRTDGRGYLLLQKLKIAKFCYLQIHSLAHPFSHKIYILRYNLSISLHFMCFYFIRNLARAKISANTISHGPNRLTDFRNNGKRTSTERKRIQQTECAHNFILDSNGTWSLKRYLSFEWLYCSLRFERNTVVLNIYITINSVRFSRFVMLGIEVEI